MQREAGSTQAVPQGELAHAAQEAAKTGKPQRVRYGAGYLAVSFSTTEPRTQRTGDAQPPRRRRKSGIITADDPLFQLAGIGDSGIEGGISGHKHEYIGKAMRHT